MNNKTSYLITGIILLGAISSFFIYQNLIKKPKVE